MSIYKELNQALLPTLRTIITDVVPGGAFHHNEYKASTIYGGHGSSFSFNVDTGVWADFAADHAGGDIIDLYAKIKNINMYESAKLLADKVNFKLPAQKTIPPDKFFHHSNGPSSGVWHYHDRSGKQLGFVARYDNGERRFSQHSYDIQGKIIHKSIQSPAPLYRLPVIIRNPDKPIIICEGEKSAEAAQKIVGHHYICTTSIGGSKAFKKTNWHELSRRDVLIWPDNDEPGLKYAQNVSLILTSITSSLKIIRVDKQSDIPKKWDAADALALGWDYDNFSSWLLNSVDTIKPIKAEVVSSGHPGPQARPLSYEAVSAPSISIQDNPEVDAFSQARIYETWQNLSLQMNANQTAPHSNVSNVIKILTKHPRYAGKFKKDMFTLKRFIDDKQYEEHFDLRLMCEIQSIFMLPKITRKNVEEALELIYAENTFNSAKDWLTSLKWDGKPRIDSFFVDYYETTLADEYPDYTRDVSKNFWLSMCKRILQPGCKVDNLVILEGEQGIMKTSSIQVIGGEYFGRALIAPNDKDNTMKFRGKFIIELAELRSSNYATDDQVKAFFDEQSDEMRDPYGRVIKANPRSFVFIGTTNDENYLKDPTGSRRYWPMVATKINIDLLAQDREQLFAEACMRALNDECHWMVHEEQALNVRTTRQQMHDDSWLHTIEDYLDYNIDFKLNDLMSYGLGFTANNAKPTDNARACRILRSLGWKNTPRRATGHQRLWWKQGHIPKPRPRPTPTQTPYQKIGWQD